MQLTRRALLGLSSTLGLAGCMSTSDDDTESVTDTDSNTGPADDQEPYSTEPVPNRDGAWTWHQDPRANHIDGVTYFGSVDSTGSIKVCAVDHRTKSVEETILNTNLLKDDHIGPVVHQRSDGHLVVYYARESDVIRYRSSTEPLSIESFEKEQTVETAVEESSSVSYPNPIYLPDEETFFLFYRGAGSESYENYWNKSRDEGRTWELKGEDAQQLTNFYGRGIRTYCKFLKKEDSRLHATFHRANVSNDNIRDYGPDGGIYDFFLHGYYENDSFYHMDGTEIVDLDQRYISYSEADGNAIAFASEAATNRMRVWDLALDENKYPHILYTDIIKKEDHKYYRASWDGSEWKTYKITDGGAGLNKSNRDYYSGGMCFDHNNPDRVAAAVAPKAGWGEHDIYEYETNDDGKTWLETRITDCQDTTNYRPAPVQNPIDDLWYLWLSGEFNDFTDYDTVVTSTLEKTK